MSRGCFTRCGLEKEATEEPQVEVRAERRGSFSLLSWKETALFYENNPERQKKYNRWSISWCYLLCKRFYCSIHLNVFLVYFRNGFIFENDMHLCYQRHPLHNLKTLCEDYAKNVCMFTIQKKV